MTTTKVFIKCAYCDYAKEISVGEEQLKANLSEMKNHITEEQLKAFRSVKVHMGVKHSKEPNYYGSFPTYQQDK